jgi:hypothetical protein
MKAKLEMEETEKKKKIMNNMVKYIQESKEETMLEDRRRAEIQVFYEDCYHLFDQYDSDLKHAFNVYAKQDAKDLEG